MIKFDKGSLFDFIREYLKIYLPKQRKVSPNTIRSYRESLELLVDFVKERKCVPLRDVTFEMMTSDMIAAFLDHLETERGCRISTRNNRLAAVRAFFEYAAAMDVTTVTFLKELKKVPVKKPDAVDVVTYMSESAVASVISQPNAATAKGLRDRFIMILMYDTAARIQEITDIKLCDFRITKPSTLTLHGKGDKMRSVPLMERTVTHLRKYLSEFHGNEPLASERPLFYSVIKGVTKPLSDRHVRNMVKEYGHSAREKNIEVPDNIHPHLFRHSRAMHLYQHGMDLTLISQWLGHANLETTLVYYAK